LQVYTGYLRKNLEVNTSAVLPSKTFAGILQVYTGYRMYLLYSGMYLRYGTGSLDFLVGN